METYILQRVIDSNKAILGILKDPKGEEISKTLENPYLDNKPFLSSIPCGTYDVESYSSDKYSNVWEIKNVPGRSKILFHNGNVASHTQGCILVGAKFGFLNDQLAVLSSQHTLDKLRDILPPSFRLIIESA